MNDLYIFRGHGNGDVGACGGGLTEEHVANVLTQKVVGYLKSKGVQVQTNTLHENNYEVNIATENNLHYGITIHMNSSSNPASGIECFVPLNEKYFNIEVEILKNISQLLGIPNRGIKSRDYNTENVFFRINGEPLSGTDYYKEIRDGWRKGISSTILEVGFMNSNDVHKVLQNCEEISIIIANAILREMGKELILHSQPVPETPTPPTNTKFYQVVTGSFSSKENAENRVKELKSKGFDSFIQQK